MSESAKPRTRAELAVVIPTRDRRPILIETLTRLARHTAGLPIEVIVVDDGSTDDSVDAVAGFGGAAPWPLHVLRQSGSGPAAARNLGVGQAVAPVCMFIGDDSLPTAGLVQQHLAFHSTRTAPEDALLGLVTPAPPLNESVFIRWLHEDGAQFGYAFLEPGKLVPPVHFWTSNVSVKRALLLRVGGFDEGFLGAACEDTELGVRLARAGMRLHYDPAALALHFHPTDLTRSLERMRTAGIAFRRLCELVPDRDGPRRPGARHRLKAGALTLRMIAARSDASRRAAWRFLCDEVQREAFWGVEGPSPRIGRSLARIAASDPESSPPQSAAAMPLPEPPASRPAPAPHGGPTG